MTGSGGGKPKLDVVGFGDEGPDEGPDIVIFILGIEAALSFAAKVLLRVEDLEDEAERGVAVFARPRRGATGSGGGLCCSGDVMETVRLSSLPGSVPAKPGGDARDAMTSGGAVGVVVAGWG